MVRRVIAKTKRARPTQSASRPEARSSTIIAFPVFERYGDQILEWLSELNSGAPDRRTATRLASSMRRTIGEMDRVRNSPRHSNLVTFLEHAIGALKIFEWDGARYLLMTSLAVMTTRSGTHDDLPARATVRQLPLRTEATIAGLAPNVTMGMVTG